jgi:hypothetical protein
MYQASWELEGCAGVDTMGFASVNTSATTITPSATIDTLGAYTQIVSATARDYVGLFSMMDFAGTGAPTSFLVDIAIGASGSEIVLLPKRNIYGGDVTNNLCPPYGGFQLFNFIPINIPTGTRLSARTQASKASAANVGVVLYGVYR